MPRLFVAVDCPETIQEQLLELCDLSLESASWLDPEQFHLTLQFIGDVDHNTFHSIVETLSEVRMTDFELLIKGVGFFPQKKSPRILWAGLEKNEALFQLQKKIENRIRRLHVPLENRKFHPHITLARLRNPSSDQIGGYLMQNNLFKTPPFLVQSFSLYSSVLTPHGAVYTEEANYPFLN